MTEKITLVDENNNITGYEEKLKVHQLGLLHAAFSIFIFNDKEEMLIQKRHPAKYHSGGLWANSCCSHPRQDEIIDQAIHRRLREELGFDCPLKKIFDFTYRVEFENGLIEHELDNVFLGRFNGPVHPNPQKIQDVKWLKLDDLASDIKNRPAQYAYWFKRAWPRVIKFISHYGAL